MSSFWKKILLAATFIALVISLSWAGFFRAFSPPPVKISPAGDLVLRKAAPKIKGSWQLFPLASLKIKQLLVDGKDVTAKAIFSRNSFSYLPPESLREGKQTIKAFADYRFVFSQPLAVEASFVIDTVRPVIDLDSHSNIIATQVSKLTIKGRTEPGAELVLKFNGRPLPSPKIYGGGGFWIDLAVTESVSALEIEAKDKAGNDSTGSYQVLIDQDTPQITGSLPEDGSLQKNNELQTKVSVEEETSGIKQIRIWIDEDEYQVDYENETRKTALVNAGELAEGTHLAQVEAADLAHNTTTGSWSFTVDSTETFGDSLIYPGAKGADVKELQARLMAMGFGLKRADGAFKDETIEAVRAFQQAKGLAQTSRIGPEELNILRPQKLDISQGPFANARLVLSVSKRTLSLYNGDALIKSYPVAVGMGGGFSTPIGHFFLKKKEINPTWYPPAWADVAEPVRPGPNNPLGNRRLLLNIPAYGIHGTNKPSSIGKAVTHGCIRMYPSDILELYEVVSVGTKVDIIR